MPAMQIIGSAHRQIISPATLQAVKKTFLSVVNSASGKYESMIPTLSDTSHADTTLPPTLLTAAR